MKKRILYICLGVAFITIFIRPLFYASRYPMPMEEYLEEFFNPRIPSSFIPFVAKHWKCYSDHCVLGDFLDLSDPGDYVRNDTLFMNNVPKAVITNCFLRVYSYDYILTLKRIPDDEEGQYIS